MTTILATILTALITAWTTRGKARYDWEAALHDDAEQMRQELRAEIARQRTMYEAELSITRGERDKLRERVAALEIEVAGLRKFRCPLAPECPGNETRP
jgi:hypothetical protein